MRAFVSTHSCWLIDDERMGYLRYPRDGNSAHPYVPYAAQWTPLQRFVVWTRDECAENDPLHYSKARGSVLDDNERYLCVTGRNGYWIDTIVIETEFVELRA